MFGLWTHGITPSIRFAKVHKNSEFSTNTSKMCHLTGFVQKREIFLLIVVKIIPCIAHLKLIKMILQAWKRRISIDSACIHRLRFKNKPKSNRMKSQIYLRNQFLQQFIQQFETNLRRKIEEQIDFIPSLPEISANDSYILIDSLLLLFQIFEQMEVNGILEKDELEHIRKIFNKFDLKGDGNITFECLAKAMRFWGLQPTQQQITNIINEYDLDGDGHIDFSEYKEIYKARRPQPTQQDILNAFHFFDKNNEGLITEKMIQTAALEMGMSFTIDQIEKLMEDLDEDKDGYISWKDFLKAVSE